MSKQEKKGDENVPEKTQENVLSDSIEPKQKSEAEMDTDLAIRMSKKKSLISASEYWNFEKNPEFIGRYIGDHINEADGNVIGYDFQEYKTKEVYIISNSHSITKAVEHPDVVNDPEGLLYITFFGKVELKDGHTFNKFKIDLI